MNEFLKKVHRFVTIIISAFCWIFFVSFLLLEFEMYNPEFASKIPGVFYIAECTYSICKTVVKSITMGIFGLSLIK